MKRENGKFKFEKDEVLANMPYWYTIFMVTTGKKCETGWYVADKINGGLRKFQFDTYDYNEVLDYAMSIE